MIPAKIGKCGSSLVTPYLSSIVHNDRLKRANLTGKRGGFGHSDAHGESIELVIPIIGTKDCLSPVSTHLLEVAKGKPVSAG